MDCGRNRPAVPFACSASPWSSSAYCSCCYCKIQLVGIAAEQWVKSQKVISEPETCLESETDQRTVRSREAQIELIDNFHSGNHVV